MLGIAAVVAGTYGTSGTAAVRWAAREAGRRRLPPRIVQFFDRDWPVGRHDHQGEPFEAAEEAARAARAVAPAVVRLVGFSASAGLPVVRAGRAVTS